MLLPICTGKSVTPSLPQLSRSIVRWVPDCWSRRIRRVSHELVLRQLHFRTEVQLPVEYKGVHLDCGYRMDLVVEDKLAVELKSVDKILPIHQAQLMTYLRLSKMRVGLLINFNVRVLRDGIVRRIL